MSSALFAKAKENFLAALLTSDLKIVLVDSADYTLDLAAHDFLDDIPAGARVATSGNLANKSVTAGVFNADDVTFTGVSGDQFECIVLYIDTGNAGTSRLIACIDTATGLPCTPNSGDITVTWDNGASKIFAI